MNFRKMKKNFRKNTKAISPVIATLLMIAIAVVASLVTYAWVMGYMNFTTNKSSAEIRVQSMTVSSGNPREFIIYAQNIGSGDLQVVTNTVAYVNGEMAEAVLPADIFGTTGTTGMLAAGKTATFTITASQATIASGTYATVRLNFFDGTIAEVKQTIP